MNGGGGNLVAYATGFAEAGGLAADLDLQVFARHLGDVAAGGRDHELRQANGTDRAERHDDERNIVMQDLVDAAEGLIALPVEILVRDDALGRGAGGVRVRERQVLLGR